MFSSRRNKLKHGGALRNRWRGLHGMQEVSGSIPLSSIWTYDDFRNRQTAIRQLPEHSAVKGLHRGGSLIAVCR
jgi:hypothetical protein